MSSDGHSFTYWPRPRNLPPPTHPPAFGLYRRALLPLVSKERRHLFVHPLWVTWRAATTAPMLGCDVMPLMLSTATSTTSAPAATQFNMAATPEDTCTVQHGRHTWGHMHMHCGTCSSASLTAKKCARIKTLYGTTSWFQQFSVVIGTFSYHGNNLAKKPCLKYSVADLDPGYGAFLNPGPGIRDGQKSGSGSDEHPRSYFRELRNHFLG